LYLCSIISPSLEIVLSHYTPFIVKLGFAPSEERFEKLKREVLEYQRQGFRCKNSQVINPNGYQLMLIDVQNLSFKSLDDFPLEETLRYSILHSFYCGIINLEADTDYLENLY